MTIKTIEEQLSEWAHYKLTLEQQERELQLKKREIDDEMRDTRKLLTDAAETLLSLMNRYEREQGVVSAVVDNLRITLATTPGNLEITDEAAVPEQFVWTERKIDKEAAKAFLAAHKGDLANWGEIRKSRYVKISPAKI